MQFLFVALCLAGLVARATAAGLQPIDPNKRADVTGQTLSFPTLNFDNIPSPTTRTQPVSPVGGQLVDRNKLVETKIVDFPTREYPTIPMNTVPRQNFAAKRALIEQPAVETPGYQTDPAKIKKRTIRPYSPAGAKELVDQLNGIP